MYANSLVLHKRKTRHCKHRGTGSKAHKTANTKIENLSTERKLQKQNLILPRSTIRFSTAKLHALPFALLLGLGWLGVTASASQDACSVEDIPVGIVSTPSGSTYDEARAQFASQLGTQSLSDFQLSPLAIVYVHNENEALGIIEFAVACGYKISVRSGGHNYSGFSSCRAGTRCIQVDLSSLDSFSLAPDESNYVTLGVGLRLEPLSQMLAANGLFLPMGLCDDVAVGGHLQSSALGLFGRTFGLGMDHVKSFRLATAEGLIQTVTPESDASLFKAVLGGGPGSWGVVLDYTLEAIPGINYPHSAGVIMTWLYSHELLVELGTAFNKLQALPEGSAEYTGFLVVTPVTYPIQNGDLTHRITVLFLWIGETLGSLYDESNGNYQKFIRPLQDIQPPLDVSLNGTVPLPLLSAANIFPFKHGDYRYHIHQMGSDTFSYDETYFERAATEVDSRIAMGTYSSMQFLAMGGKIQQNKGLNAYAYRDNGMLLDDWVFFLEEEQDAVVRASIEDFRKDTRSYWDEKGLGTENTFMTPFSTDAKGANLAKPLWKEFYSNRQDFNELMRAKSAIDPCDLFSAAFTVPPFPSSNSHEKCKK